MHKMESRITERLNLQTVAVPAHFATLAEQTFWELSHGVSTEVPNFEELACQLTSNSEVHELARRIVNESSPRKVSAMLRKVRECLKVQGNL